MTTKQDAITLHDLAEQVIAWCPTGTKQQWGEELARLITVHDEPDLRAEVERKVVAAYGQYVAGVKAAAAKVEQAEQHLQNAVGYNGRPMTPTISVRNEDGSTQLVLWIKATPRQFIDAVLREQKVIDGRNDSNAVRLDLVERILGSGAQLIDLPDLGSVCDELGYDATALNLEELPL